MLPHAVDAGLHHWLWGRYGQVLPGGPLLPRGPRGCRLSQRLIGAAELPRCLAQWAARIPGEDWHSVNISGKSHTAHLASARGQLGTLTPPLLGGRPGLGGREAQRRGEGAGWWAL